MAERLRRIGQPLPLIDVPRGRHVVRQGDPRPPEVLVISGALLAYTVDLDGHVAGLDVLGPGDAVAFRGIAHVSVRALARSALRPAPTSEVERAGAGHAVRLAEFASDLAWLDVTARIERRLQDLSARFGRSVPGGIRIELDLTQEDLAALAGTSRETANRALQRSIRSGRLVRAGRYRYLIPRQLRAVAPRTLD
jgi:CRP/FNR family transcriptional regulator, cyclic AMP receptor protein